MQQNGVPQEREHEDGELNRNDSPQVALAQLQKGRGETAVIDRAVSQPRMRVSSGSPYEPTIGFSRAIRVGDRVVVSGTAPIWPDGSCDPDPEVQARQADPANWVVIFVDEITRANPILVDSLLAVCGLAVAVVFVGGKIDKDQLRQLQYHHRAHS